MADIAAGRPVVVVDDEDRENEGDIIFAAPRGDPGADGVHGAAHLRRAVRADGGRRPDRLDIGPMTAATGTARHRVSVTVDAAARGSPPVSAPRTVRTPSGCSPIQPPARPMSYAQVTCSRCAPAGGVLVRRGHTEAAVDLARLAGLRRWAYSPSWSRTTAR